MNYKIEKINDIVLVTLEGELLTESTHKIREIVKNILKGKSKKILLDFDKVPFVDSSGVAVLVEVAQSVGNTGGRMRMCCVNKKITGVFEVVKVNKLFRVFQTHQEAFRGF